MNTNSHIPPFSVARAVRTAARNSRSADHYSPEEVYDDAIERKFTDDILKLNPTATQMAGGMLIPITRDLSAGVVGKGRNTIQQDKNATLLDRILSNAFVLDQARFYSSESNLEVPKIGSGSVAGWVVDGNLIAHGDPTFDGIPIRSYQASGSLTMTTQLMKQTPEQLDDALSDDIAALISDLLEKAMLQGTGTNQPLGIANTSGVGSVTFGGTATAAKLDEMVKSCTNAKANPKSLTWVISPATYEAWKNIELGTGNGYLLKDWTARDIPVEVSTNIDNDQVFLGDWTNNGMNWTPTILDQGMKSNSELMVEVVTNPFTKALNGKVDLVVMLHAGTACLYPEAFAISTDSGAQ